MVVLLVDGLEASVTDLRRGIDELEVGLLEGATGNDGTERLSEGDGALSAANDGSLDEEEVVADSAVMGEATHGGDGFLRDIVVGGSVAAVLTGAKSVDLLVDHGSVVETHLTGTSDLELDAGRVPGTNTGDLSQTSVGLAGKTGDAPSFDDTLDTVTLVDADHVAHLVLAENSGHGDGLLEEALGEGDLLGHGATVDLDLHNVSSLLADRGLGDLSVGNDTENLAVVLDSLGLLVLLVGVSSSVLGEGTLLASVPVLVETALAVLGQVVGPHGGEGTEATGGLNVTDKTDDNHGGAVDDGDGLNNVLLVELGARSLDFTDDVGHTSLVAHESGQVALSGSIVLGESLDTALSAAATLLREETQRTVTGVFEFSVRHPEYLCKIYKDTLFNFFL